MSPEDGTILTADAAERQSRSRLRVIDCDVHHALRSPKDLHPYLSKRWRDHLDTYGHRFPVPFTDGSPYPKTAPALSRTDSWPPNGGPPGSDLAFLQKQLLDRHNVEYGLLHLLAPHGMDQRNQDFGAAVCSAINQWQYEHWTQKDRRLKAAIVVPGEDAQAAVAEIERWAGNTDFVQVSMVTHTIEPLGRRRYWPIYEAAARLGLPVGLHTSGYNGHAITGGGWASYYVEEQHNVAISQQALAISLVCEGVFERFPALKVVIVEAGLAWVPSVAWRLDRHFDRMRDELPHLTKKPSEYLRQHMWYTTQPADEPERPEDLRRIFDWMGWDRVLYATDYPHWDMDNPGQSIKLRLSEDEQRMIYADNARAVYGFA
ncbi:MAG: hydrolase [Rhodospirillales bacterium 70-18]|nr:amidohydrolase [Rhodospirillales bacterium]OJY63445.1 MAG: hydrolase [Rhodospirillales bacterium 70-18]